MKGAILAFSLFILTLAVTLGLTGFVQFEHVRSTLSTEVKRSIQYTMLELINQKETSEINSNQAMKVFSDFFQTLVYDNYEYTIQLMGFNAKPLLLRFVVTAKRLDGPSLMRFEEAMIEEERK